jgi:hypothetical protein
MIGVFSGGYVFEDAWDNLETIVDGATTYYKSRYAYPNLSEPGGFALWAGVAFRAGYMPPDNLIDFLINKRQGFYTRAYPNFWADQRDVNGRRLVPGHYGEGIDATYFVSHTQAYKKGTVSSEPEFYFVTPDCNLASGAIQDNLATGGDLCGAWLTPNFGSNNVATIFSPSIMEGWGVRPYNYEYAAGIQQEIAPRLSASFGYFSRVYGNFMVQDNENLAKTDFTQYSVTVPTDPRLPNSGQTVTGLYDQNMLVAAKNVIKNASDFGTQTMHWDGVDLSVDARLRNGLFLQGGFSAGKTMSDNCEIVDDVPEALTLGGPAGIQAPVTTATGLLPSSYCHQETPYVTQYKGLVSYNLPWWGIRMSGTLQSLPGPQIIATNIYNNANRTTMTTLPRPFTNAQANVSLIEPASEYGDRLNQIDLRFTKIVNVGHGRIDFNVDLYNAFNSDAVIGELGTFGPVWRLPTTIIQPRFVKFAARWDF